MKKFKMHIENNRILYRMIAVFSIVCTIIILLLTSVMYTMFSREIKDEIYRSQEQSLKQISNTVRFRAEYANSLMLQVKLNKQSSKLFYSTEEDVVVDALDRMDEIRGSVKQLNSIYIYNEQDQKIFYSGENTMPAISSAQIFEDKGFIEILNNISDYPKYTPFLRMFSVKLPGGKEYQTYVYTYLLYDTYSSGTIRNIIAFNFHLGWIEDALDFITTGQNTSEELWIVDGNRHIVYTNTGELIGSTCDTEVLPDEIYEKESGYVIVGKGKDREMLVYATPTRMGYEGWTFVSRSDYAALMEPLEKVRRFIYLVCSIVFIISIVAIGRFSHAIYEPMRLTMNRVMALEKEQERKHKIDQMLFLRKLFQGNITDDINIIEKYFNQYQIEGELSGNIRMTLISIDYLNSYWRKFGNHLEETEDVIEEIIRNQFNQIYTKLLCARMQSGLWAVCVPVKEDDPDISSYFEEVNDSLKEELDITVSMAISDLGHSARDIPYLYSEAMNIYSYRYLWGQNRVITAEDIKEHGQAKFEYPCEIEKKLLNNLFNGKYEETIEAYEEFNSAIRWYTVEEIKLSFMLLAYSIKNASVKTMAETSSILLEFDRFYKKLQSVETINEVHQMYQNLIREITDKLKVYSKERHEVLIGQIKTYVQANYGNISLSMNEVSDHVNMSAAYLGRLFKQVTGTTFTEYLTKFRLNKACVLLKDTSMTVNEISDAVGFTNSSYFYIIFKKNMDCTPNQYRRQYGNTSVDEE